MVDDLLIERCAKALFWMGHRDERRWEDVVPTIREAYRQRARLAFRVLQAA